MNRILAVAAGIGIAISPPKSFEVASIKPVTTRGITNRITVEGGRLNAPIATAAGLVRWAYRPPAPGPAFYNEYQIVGAPDWFDRDRFAVEAKAETGSRVVTTEEIQEMLRSLLEDRFRLKVHRETRELPMYDLVLAKGGLKMKLSEDQTPPDPAPRGRRGTAAGPVRGRTDIKVAEAGNVFSVTMAGTAVSMPVFINTLQEGMDRPIVDKTGIEGLYDFKVTFTIPPGPNGTPADADIYVSMLSVLQELGLKVESTKAPNSVLVIDRIEKPTEN
jgi:uncharacterized protein (TIGR03435 family)